MLTTARSRWDGRERPRPIDLRAPAYDGVSEGPPRQKLLICAAPRSSSKRLARLLLGAGLGVPMEYFNENSIRALTSRWDIHRRDYLAHLYARRTANGVFASNLQQQQIRVWPYRQDVDSLFDGATVVHLVRADKRAQAASLAACLLTNDWGFEPPDRPAEFSERQMRRAARDAMAIVTAEDGHLARCFDHYRVRPIPIATEQVNRADLAVVAELSARLDVEFDRDGADRMLQCDIGPYRGHETLKSKLLEYLV
jgi:LPS sulfotransferase NodH